MEENNQELRILADGKEIAMAKEGIVKITSAENDNPGTLESVYANKGYNVTFGVDASEDALAFFGKMQEQCVAAEKAIGERVERLFTEHVGIGGKEKDEAYEQILRLFHLGYALGWNDYKTLIDKKHEIQDWRQD